mgnify:CR=1 FL=1
MGKRIDVSDLNIYYGSFQAVADVAMTIELRAVTALIGPSGCGKSSLLSAVVGIVEPASGTVGWGGRDLTRVPVHRRSFGMVFQDGQLFPHLSVGANVAFGLRMAGVARGEREARVAELLATVGLDGYADRGVTELSGGQRQRVALARSLAPRPRLLALDEPLSSLDAELRTRLAVDVRDILRAEGTTGLVVTHDPAEAEVMADRVVRMADGLLIP